ncbi:MAG: tetratricopeptide repeat protein [Acidobacteria bacterium]|nr:tetratricopeptide repeat protein [Acidobacteriota bacterium]
MKRTSLHLALTVLLLSALTPGGGLSQDVLDEPGFEVVKYSLMRFEDALRLAEQGDVHAQAELSFRYRHGHNTADRSPDIDKAIYWGRKAARQGHIVSQNRLANALAMNGKPKEAVRWWRVAAAQGDGGAQKFLASAYFEGFGVARDPVLAYQWCLLAEQALMKMPESLRWDELDDDAWTEIVLNRLEPLQSAAEMRGFLVGTLDDAELERAKRLAREWEPKTWEELQDRE